MAHKNFFRVVEAKEAAFGPYERMVEDYIPDEATARKVASAASVGGRVTRVIFEEPIPGGLSRSVVATYDDGEDLR